MKLKTKYTAKFVYLDNSKHFGTHLMTILKKHDRFKTYRNCHFVFET